MVALNTIFTIGYGSQLDLNKCTRCGADEGYNFVNRSASHCGVSARILPPPGVPPHKAGLISCAMGGSVLSTFVQQEDFYTGQNVKVLEPKAPMTLNEKLFYCACIEANRFRFSAFGREANATFDRLMVPARSEVPQAVLRFSVAEYAATLERGADVSEANALSAFSSDDLRLDLLGNIFHVENGLPVSDLDRHDTKEGPDFLPIIRPSHKQETSVDAFVRRSEVPAHKIFPKGTLYVSTDGQGSHSYAYVSATEFVPNSNVAVLSRKDGREMTLKEKLFYAYCITMNRFKFSYGRKPKGDKLKSVLLPVSIPSQFNEFDIGKCLKLYP